VGRIMGTAAYMAPEQARGKAVDKRADIWAFGVVLYEMLTGHRPFEGETISDTLAGVLTKDPEWERVPAKARPLLKSCLEKEPNRRLRDIADAWRPLEETPAPAARTRVAWIAAAVFAIATALALWAPWHGAEIGMQRPSPRLDLDLGADVSLAGDAGPAVVLSPDGTRIVFVSQDKNGVPRLFQRRLDQPTANLLSGTEGAKQPFFSPDGQWVGFFAEKKLKKTRIDGGEPVSLCDAPSGRGASWGEDDKIIATLDSDNVGLSQVPSGGGNVVPVTELGPGEASHRWPHVLPGGKFVLFTVSRVINNYDEAGIALLSLQDRSRKMLMDHAGMNPRYLPSGHLVYVTKGSLFAAPFDLKRLLLAGEATRLAEVAADTPRGFAQVDFSEAGIFAFRTRGGQGLSTPQWLDGAGKTEPLGLEAARYHYLRLSPDGARLAYVSTQGSNSDLFIYDWRRSIKTRLTNGRVTRSPVWSPDGRFVVFTGLGGMFAAETDGGGTPLQLTRSSNQQWPGTFSPDGKWLVFTEFFPRATGEIRIMPVESQGGRMRAGEPQPVVKVTNTTDACFSPDGRWLAYSNAEGGAYQIYIRAFPDTGRQVQVSNGGGIQPLWSRNGHELFYRTEDQRIMVVNYMVKGGSFIPQKPRPWYGKRIANIGGASNLDLAPDGKRFVVLMPAEDTEARETRSHVTLVMNFFDEVRRRTARQAK
jgi:Tol biopolymer transport system component